MADVYVQNEGTIVLLDLSVAAAEWVEEHVTGEKTWFGSRLVVEHRYVADLLEGLQANGFAVAEGVRA